MFRYLEFNFTVSVFVSVLLGLVFASMCVWTFGTLGVEKALQGLSLGQGGNVYLKGQCCGALVKR